MPKHGACNLGSINLSEFVKKPFETNAYFDTDEFVKAVKIAIAGLDAVLDENANNHALPEQQEMAMGYRNVGLGIMGAYDCLVKLGLTYGSPDSIKFMDSLMDLMFRSAVIASIDLAKEKGSFPRYKPCVLNSHIIKKHFSTDELISLGAYDFGLRNCSLLSIAPAGSIGTMLNISTGCEPAFALSYTRKTESLNNGEDKYYKVYIGVANEYIEKFHPENDELPSCFNIAQTIKWRDRVDMQSALQEHVDTAISSTINLPNNITIDEIEQLYLYAWEKGLKGVTIFRDGCKRTGILSTEPNKKEPVKKATTKGVNFYDNPDDLPRGTIIRADDNCIGKKRTLHTGCGTLHCEAFFDPNTGDLLETYFSKGSAGGCANTLCGLSRMISLAARGGIDVYSIVDQLKSAGSCPSYAVRSATKHDTSKGSSCPVAIGNAIIDMYEELQRELFDSDLDNKDTANDKNAEYEQAYCNKCESTKCVSSTKRVVVNPCPICGSELTFEGGCNICRNCGYSKCE